MDRKRFISSVLPLGLGATGLAQMSKDLNEFPLQESLAEKRIPSYLKRGDLVGISCPAGFISLEDIQPAISRIREWGFEVMVGETVGKKEDTFGGSDEQRLSDLQKMLDDRKIKAILCGRGGYGAVRIIDQVDFKKFVLNPKWIIGFSDITVLHSHINRNFNIATIHSKMCNSFPADWSSADTVQVESIESIRQCLSGMKMEYKSLPNTHNKFGEASGQLIGGNLKTIESLLSSNSDLITNDKILFLEDTGEYLYSIDRMFWSLKRSRKLSRLKGLIIGGFKVKQDDPGEEFGKTLEEIILEKTRDYHYPVCFDFPVGHQKYNVALKCGVTHLLKVSENKVALNEL